MNYFIAAKYKPKQKQWGIDLYYGTDGLVGFCTLTTHANYCRINPDNGI
ncbi:hypothetical protein [Citromicrobium bathyomarinum]